VPFLKKESTEAVALTLSAKLKKAEKAATEG